MPQQRITEVTLIPDGMEWSDYNLPTFSTKVVYRGTKEDGIDLYAVMHIGSELSRAGNWAFHVPKFKRKQYRWETFDEALQWAVKVANDVKVNGRTWAEWQQYHGRT